MAVQKHTTGQHTHRVFHAAPIVLTVLVTLLLIHGWITWYSREVSLPRYCDNPEQTLTHLARVLHDERPAGDNPRRPYLIAAKLLFLVPRQSEERIPDYLQRVQAHLQDTCR